MIRTKAHREARALAVDKDTSLEKLILTALQQGVFINPTTNRPYSLSWVLQRLKNNNEAIGKNIVKKLHSVSFD